MTTKVVFIQSQGVDGETYDAGDVVEFEDDARARELLASGAVRLSFDAPRRAKPPASPP